MPSAVSGPATEVVVFSQSVELTDAQIKALPTTSVAIVPSPGPGKALVFMRGFVELTLAEVYTNVNAVAVMTVGPDGQGGSNFIPVGDGNFLDLGAGTWVGFLTPKAAPGYPIAEQIGESVGSSITNWEDKAIWIGALNPYPTNADGNFTGGDAANILKVTVLYTIIDV